MKDETLIYLGVGVLAFIWLTKKPVPTYPQGIVTVGPVTPTQQQPAALVSSFLAKLFNTMPGNAAVPTIQQAQQMPNSAFTPITSAPYDPTGNQSVLYSTDSTGVTTYSNGAIFDPNAGGGSAYPTSLPQVDLGQGNIISDPGTNNPAGFDFSGD